MTSPSRGARILIISNGALCRNPRALKEAETLGAAGYDVTVLTVRNHPEAEAMDVDLIRSRPFRRETLDLIPGYGTGRAALLCQRVLQSAARGLTARLGLQLIDGLGPARAMLARACDLPADLTIVHNEVPHWVGVRLMRNGRSVAADMEDWHSEDLLPEARFSRPLALIRKTERELLHKAKYVTTTSESLAQALHERYGGARPEVVANAFLLQDRPRRGSPGDPPSFFWFSQTLGPGRGLEKFLAGWSLMKHPSRVVLLGEANPAFQERLLASVPSVRRGALSFLGLVPPLALPAIIALHDLGLALEEGAIISRNLTITNKILQYLNAGLAVVASDTAGQREVLGRSIDAGVVIDTGDAGRLAAELDGLVADPQGLRRRQSAARRLAEQVYCWEKEGPRLLEIVEKALRTS